MLVYPNPSNGIIHVRLSRALVNTGSTLLITDIMGRQMDAYNLDRQKITLDLTHYPTGIYFFHYADISRRIIIG
jgi:hypothetical protein